MGKTEEPHGREQTSEKRKPTKTFTRVEPTWLRYIPSRYLDIQDSHGSYLAHMSSSQLFRIMSQVYDWKIISPTTGREDCTLPYQDRHFSLFPFARFPFFFSSYWID
ncbi:hypothetical protein NXS19_009206 [Fusarium pseudograminearum]|nr:hypothetical protein NXS19_009206 [Fusarium pseudograminearum]